jgi:hypothetical protein
MMRQALEKTRNLIRISQEREKSRQGNQRSRRSRRKDHDAESNFESKTWSLLVTQRWGGEMFNFLFGWQIKGRWTRRTDCMARSWELEIPYTRFEMLRNLFDA